MIPYEECRQKLIEQGTYRLYEGLCTLSPKQWLWFGVPLLIITILGSIIIYKKTK